MTNDKQCPVCNEANLCHVAEDKNIADCWCKDLSLEATIRKKIAGQYNRKQCLCAACIKKFNADFYSAS